MIQTTKTTISYDDYLRLVGLLTLARDHNRTLNDIRRSALAITGEYDDNDATGEYYGHTGDAVYDDNGGRADELLRKLGIAVNPAQNGVGPAEATGSNVCICAYAYLHIPESRVDDPACPVHGEGTLP